MAETDGGHGSTVWVAVGVIVALHFAALAYWIVSWVPYCVSFVCVVTPRFLQRGLVKGLRELTNTDMRVRVLGSVAVGEREKKEK